MAEELAAQEAIARAIRHRDYPHEHLSPGAAREIILGLLRITEDYWMVKNEPPEIRPS